MARSSTRAHWGIVALLCFARLALMPSVASAVCGAVSNPTYTSANAQSGVVNIYWSSSNPVIILENTSSITDTLTNGTSYSVGTAVGSMSPQSRVQFGGSATTFQRTGTLNTFTITNGTTAYYKVFANATGNCYSSGVTLSVTPGGSTLWNYDTTSTTLVAPAIDGSDVVVWGGNDNTVHGVSASTGTLGTFVPYTAATGAIQARPPIIPSGYSSTGVNVAYVSSQDGYIYAVNTATGASVWPGSGTTACTNSATRNGNSSCVPGASKLQAGAAVWLRSIDRAVTVCGINLNTTNMDIVLVGTRDTSTTSANVIYALNGSTSAVTSTGGGNCQANGTTVQPGDWLWKLTGGGTNPNLDKILSTPFVDYTNNVVWVTSNSAVGTSQPSLWKLNITNGTLFNGSTTCNTGGSVWCLGDTDYSPAQSGDGTWMYVGQNTGNTIKLVQGSTIYTYTDASGAGAVRGPYPMATGSFGATTTINYVNGANATSTGSTCQIAGLSLTAGNTLVVFVMDGSGSVSLISSSVSDTRSSAYGVRGYSYGSAVHGEVWVAPKIAGTGTSSETITVNLISARPVVCMAAQYSGVGTIGKLVQLFSQSSKNPTITASTVTQDANNWVVTGYVMASSTAATCGCTGTGRNNGSGWPAQASTPVVTGAIVDVSVATAGASFTTAITHATATWAEIGVELRSKTVDTIFFTRNATVHELAFTGAAAPTLNWWVAAGNWAGNPTGVSSLVDDGAGHIFVGDNKGVVHQLEIIGGNDLKQVTLPGGAQTLGDPSYDWALNRIYVGTADGHVYAITTPF